MSLCEWYRCANTIMHAPSWMSGDQKTISRSLLFLLCRPRGRNGDLELKVQGSLAPLLSKSSCQLLLPYSGCQKNSLDMKISPASANNRKPNLHSSFCLTVHGYLRYFKARVLKCLKCFYFILFSVSAYLHFCLLCYEGLQFPLTWNAIHSHT